MRPFEGFELSLSDSQEVGSVDAIISNRFGMEEREESPIWLVDLVADMLFELLNCARIRSQAVNAFLERMHIS